MADFFAQVGNFFAAIGGFLLNILQGLCWIVASIPRALAYVTITIGYIPAPIIPLAFGVIAICVVFLIIDR